MKNLATIDQKKCAALDERRDGKGVGIRPS
jgi:hypothetical protein